jgi:Cys-tRNA(Pro)/Cys-tRNA(Cys) deacylase
VTDASDAARDRRPVIRDPDTPATRALTDAGVAHRVVQTVPANSAEESAELQGIELGALLRTLVVRRGEDDYLFVLVPGGRRFDWPKLRAHLGVKRMSMPDADEARAVTGYERGAITPFGATRAWPVLIDAAALGRPLVAIGGGMRGVNLHLSPDDLVTHLRAEVVDVSVADAADGPSGS